MTVLERFLKYISIDTASNSESELTPSTNNQRVFADLLNQELQELGLETYFDVENCYLYATLKGDESLPKIGFIAHLDTSEDAKSDKINPNIIYDYDGEDITLPNKTIMSIKEYPDLIKKCGRQSNTKYALVYINDIVNQDVLEELKKLYGDFYWV